MGSDSVHLVRVAQGVTQQCDLSMVEIRVLNESLGALHLGHLAREVVLELVDGPHDHLQLVHDEVRGVEIVGFSV